MVDATGENTTMITTNATSAATEMADVNDNMDISRSSANGNIMTMEEIVIMSSFSTKELFVYPNTLGIVSLIMIKYAIMAPYAMMNILPNMN